MIRLTVPSDNKEICSLSSGFSAYTTMSAVLKWIDGTTSSNCTSILHFMSNSSHTNFPST